MKNAIKNSIKENKLIAIDRGVEPETCVRIAQMAQACLDACKAAKEMGLTVSCDLNYRNKLWSREEAGQCMAELMPYVDVCIANEEDCKW